MNEKMNETKKEEVDCAKLANEIVDALSNLPIGDQNAVFAAVRKSLADYRMSFIAQLKDEETLKQKEISFADETLHAVILAELK